MDEKIEPFQKPINDSSKDEKNSDLGEEIVKTDQQSVTVSTVEKQESEPSVLLSNTDLHFDGLSEVPVEYSVQLPKVVKDQVKEQKEVRDEPLNCTSGAIVQLQTLNQIQVPDDSSRLELSPTSVTQSISSISSPSQLQQKSQQVVNGNTVCITEEGKNSPRPRLPPVPIQKTPSDGYNWRKYGQKQVKSPEGSRSYYRCTFSDCCAKKIECSDHSNRIVETIYRSHHNHEPPQILNCNREKKQPVLRTAALGGSTSVTGPLRATTDLVSYTPKEPSPGTDKILEAKEQESSSSDETMEVNAKDVNVDGPESKKRKKRTSPDELESLPKSGNKPKFVVHAAGDVGISGDGFRWRKYGQKMVKGNPHPRNYYRCTSAGCPVRKQIERAVDSASALIITYKGGHNHDMPVPKKRHGPKSTIPDSSMSSVSGVDLQTDKNETHQSLTQISAEKEGKASGESLNLGGSRTAEPARTLVSVGFEAKPC